MFINFIKYTFLILCTFFLCTVLSFFIASVSQLLLGLKHGTMMHLWQVASIACLIGLFTALFYSKAKTFQNNLIVSDILVFLVAFPLAAVLLGRGLFSLILVLAIYLITHFSSLRRKIQARVSEQGNFISIKPSAFYLWYVVSFGWCRYYWWYKNWQFLKAKNQDSSWPIARAIWPMFFYSTFIKEINQQAREKDLPPIKYGDEMGDYYLYLFIFSIVITFAGGIFMAINHIMPVYYFKFGASLIALLLISVVFCAPLQKINQLQTATFGAQLPNPSSFFAKISLSLIGIMIWSIFIFYVAANSFGSADILSKVGMYDRAYVVAEKRAEKNDAESQFMLGKMFLTGVGREQDAVKGVRWLESAANQGHVKAQEMLGEVYRQGMPGVDKDYRQSIFWYEKALKNGSAYAANDLAAMHHRGWGVAPDDKAEKALFTLAAERGDNYAMYNLGLEERRQKNYAEAAKWYQKAIDADSTDNFCAAFDLGMLYAGGNGVKTDSMRAKKLLDRAATQLMQSYADTFLGDVENLKGLKKKDFVQIENEFVNYNLAQAKGKTDTAAPQPSKITQAMNEKIKTTCWD